MKKVLAILVIAMFLGGITAPAFASNNISLTTISNLDDDPKKAKKSAKKTSDVDVKTPACGETSSDCKTKSSDCATKCGDKASVTEAKASDCATKAKTDCGGK